MLKRVRSWWWTVPPTIQSQTKHVLTVILPILTGAYLPGVAKVAIFQSIKLPLLHVVPVDCEPLLVVQRYVFKSKDNALNLVNISPTTFVLTFSCTFFPCCTAYRTYEILINRICCLGERERGREEAALQSMSGEKAHFFYVYHY